MISKHLLAQGCVFFLRDLFLAHVVDWSELECFGEWFFRLQREVLMIRMYLDFMSDEM
jgi:hypothetical protein